MDCSVGEIVDIQSDEGREKITHTFRYAEIGRCVSSVTHDVNNLLGAIMAYAELVGLDSGVSVESRRMLGEIIGAVRKASGLIGNLTDISRKARSDVRIVDPANLVDRVLDLRRYDMKVARIAVATDYEAALPALAVELPQLQQALGYLVCNAIEALEPEKARRLDIKIGNSGDAIVIAVANSGPRVAESEREHIFEPFYTTKGPTHLGLGLTVARAVIERHDGDLTYDSEQGFVLRLPKVSRFSSNGLSPPNGQPA